MRGEARAYPEHLLKSSGNDGERAGSGTGGALVRTGESSTEPTELMFVRSRKSSPILRMISLWLMSILPVSLMISGMSFVSSIVVEMSFSN